MSKATDYKNKYIAAKYDRINLTVPKGSKAAIEARAAALGLSVNGYINRLLQLDMKTPPEQASSSEAVKVRKQDMDIYLF